MSYRMSGDEANELTNEYTNLFKQSYYLRTKQKKNKKTLLHNYY